MGGLECVRETLALAVEEVKPRLKSEQLPGFWELLWERYVESKLDYKSNEETLRAKQRQAGPECLQLLEGRTTPTGVLRAGQQGGLLRKVFVAESLIERSVSVSEARYRRTDTVLNPTET